jgi:hypothetical protein
VSPGTVIVGHSPGGRVALAVAARTKPAAVILLAPALGPLSILTDASLESWKLKGCRQAVRPNPETGTAVTFQVPVSFAEDILELEAPTVPDVPVLTVCMTSDARQNACTFRLLADFTETIVVVDGPHRFWEDQDAFRAVTRVIHDWVAVLDVGRMLSPARPQKATSTRSPIGALGEVMADVPHERDRGARRQPS